SKFGNHSFEPNRQIEFVHLFLDLATERHKRLKIKIRKNCVLCAVLWLKSQAAIQLEPLAVEEIILDRGNYRSRDFFSFAEPSQRYAFDCFAQRSLAGRRIRGIRVHEPGRDRYHSDSHRTQLFGPSLRQRMDARLRSRI